MMLCSRGVLLLYCSPILKLTRVLYEKSGNGHVENLNSRRQLDKTFMICLFVCSLEMTLNVISDYLRETQSPKVSKVRKNIFNNSDKCF